MMRKSMVHCQVHVWKNGDVFLVAIPEYVAEAGAVLRTEDVYRAKGMTVGQDGYGSVMFQEDALDAEEIHFGTA